MNFSDIYNARRDYDSRKEFKNDSIALKILYEFMDKSGSYDLKYIDMDKPVESLLLNYMSLVNTEKGKLLEEIMIKNNFNYYTSIHNAIYKLLGKSGNKDLALKYPGILSINEENNGFRVKTKVGDIVIYKASSIFENSNVSYIFNRNLSGKCYARAYDFIKEMPNNYKVILASNPYFFTDEYYHVYLEGNNHFIDIASNSIYGKKYNNIINKGRVIKKLTYDEIREDYRELRNKDNNINRYMLEKLYKLTLYHDRKNILK